MLFLQIFLIIHLIHLIYLDTIDLCEESCNINIIKEKLTFIYTSKRDNTIYQYDTSRQALITFDRRITSQRNILKFDEDHFMVIGVGDNNNLFYQHFEIEGDSINENNSVDSGFSLTGVEILHSKVIGNMQFLVYGIVNSAFMIFKIGQSSKIITSPISEGTKLDIQCDSSDDYYFCFLTIEIREGINRHYRSFYERGNFANNNNIIKGTICDKNCFLGNIVKVDDLNHRYLVCYKKKSTQIYIICQYFSFKDNNLKIEESYNILEMTGEFYNENPLILFSS